MNYKSFVKQPQPVFIGENWCSW